MNILLFSPVALTSAIARVSHILATECRAAGIELQVVATDKSAVTVDDSYNFGLPLLAWDRSNEEISAALVEGYVPVYQVGNSYEFHAGILHWLDREPGVVCLHDYVLTNLIFEWRSHKDRHGIEEYLRSFAPASDVAELLAASNVSEFLRAATSRIPCTDWFSSRSSAVIVHSSWGAEAIQASSPGVIVAAKMPYTGSMPIPTKADRGATTQEAPGEGLTRLLTFGDINPNKTPDRIIQAIGQLDNRSEYEYVLAGRISQDYSAYLQQIAASSGVSLTVLGRVDDATLARELCDADAVACLRDPVLEGASASALEAMSAEKVVLAYDAGFYSDLPDNAIIKVPNDMDQTGLVAAIRTLRSPTSDLDSIARNAVNYVSQEHTAKKYVEALRFACSAHHESKLLIDAVSGVLQTLWELRSGPARADSLEKLSIFNHRFVN